MSAYVGLIHDGKAFLWSDAATCDMSGVLLAIERKTLVLPGQRLALTGRGVAGLCELAVAYLVSEGVTADDFALDAGAVFAGLDDYLAPFLHDPASSTYDFAVAGWSDAKGGPFLCCWGHVHGEETVLRWEKDGMSAPNLHPQEVPMFVALGVTDPLDPERYGRHYMTALRNRRFLLWSETEPPGHYRIGGHVLQTTVGSEGVTQAELLEWEDTIGERIDPFGVARRNDVVAFGGRRRRV